MDHRNNTTPLLSLSQLGQLQRANSAASRLQALERLTGEQQQRPALGRSNTVATAGGGDQEGTGVGGGLERRSVVGRRMMERLGNRVAARQQQQQQREQTQQEGLAVEPPVIQLHPPSSFPGVALEPIAAAQPRSASRQTARSASAAGSDAGSAVFEYDAHLSRNASLRMAAAAREQMEQREAGAMRDEQPGEEVLESPVRAVPLARYTLTDSGLSLGREIGNQHHQIPQTIPEPNHLQSDTRESHHMPMATPSSSTSSSMIPVIISSSEDTTPHPEPPAHPLLPALGDIYGVPHVEDRRQDSMSRFPQGVTSGTGSSYFGNQRESNVVGDLHAWQEQQARRESESAREVDESEGYFDYFDVDQRVQDELEGEDARSDVTEKIGGYGASDRVTGDEADLSRPASFMSWEDVGDDSQVQRLPSDDDHASSSGGVMDRLRDTWRKHRTSRDESISSTTDEDGNSSRHLYSGRVTPLNASTSNMVPSYSLLPGQTSPMPAANPHDVRLQNSKLSPFLPTPTPGGGGHFAGFTPGPLLQQASDSLVLTMAGAGLGFGLAGTSTASLPDAGLSASQSSSAAASYYDLSGRTGASSPTARNEDPPMRSAGVVGKKSWLAEAFFAGAQGNAASRSGAGSQGETRRPSLGDMIMRRKPSILERYTGRKEQKEREKQQAEPSDSEDWRAGLAPPISFGGQRAADMSSARSGTPDAATVARLDLSQGTSSPRLASESPTVSTVIEAGDERSTVYHPSLSPAAILEDPTAMPSDPSHRRPSVRERLLPGPTSGMMAKLNAVLTLAPDARPDVLDDPPRRLVMSLPVRQVVNLHTVKDRYLFLFSDILVIAKPLLTAETDSGISLNTQFSVKSVVPLQHMQLTADQQEHRKGETESARHPIVQQFIDSFAEDPDRAVELLEQKGGLQADRVTLASVLFKTAELDKEQLGKYLCSPHREDLLRAFLERFHFGGLPIDQAIRMFLLAIRLPADGTASERLLGAMANAWHTANSSKVAFDVSLTAGLIMSIVQLNESLHPANSLGFAPFHGSNVDEFVAGCRIKDSKSLVPEELLRSVFESIQHMPLVQALRTTDTIRHSRAITILPIRLPTRLPHGVWSAPIKVCIPEPDSQFAIELSGNGLSFDPPRLDFSQGTVASFRVKGERLGLRTVLFRRIGTNAPCYGHLANTHTFAVERSFMQHIFHLTFQNHLGLKRKYLYSLQDAETKANTFDILQQLIARTREAKQNWKDTPVMSSASRKLADQISIKVLQSSLIDPSKEGKSGGSRKIKKDPQGPVTPNGWLSNLNTPGSLEQTSVRQPVFQQNFTISPALEQTYRFDDTASARDVPVVEAIDPKKTMSVDVGGSDKSHTGKELVFICRQNSLLPVVLGFLRYGTPSEGSSTEQSDATDAVHAARSGEPMTV